MGGINFRQKISCDVYILGCGGRPNEIRLFQMVDYLRFNLLTCAFICRVEIGIKLDC